MPSLKLYSLVTKESSSSKLPKIKKEKTQTSVKGCNRIGHIKNEGIRRELRIDSIQHQMKAIDKNG
jgi:hypothetical protein